MKKEQLEKVYEYLESQKDEMVTLLKEVVNIESSSRAPGTVIHVAKRFRELFEAEGFKCEIVDVGSHEPSLIGVLGENRVAKPVIFSGHMDTALQPELYQPNAFKIEDGKAYGPGVLDMKGGIIISLFVVKALNHIGYDERPLKIVFSGDEEIGHIGGKGAEILQEAATGGVCAFNLETGLIDNSICYGRKGRLEAHISIHGVEVHAGNDFINGRNAIAEMAHKILEIEALTDLEKGTTVVSGVIQGGTISNAIPKFCKLEVECRFDTVSEMKRFQENLESICAKTYVEGTTTEVEYISSFAPYETTDVVMNFWEFVKETAIEAELEEVKGKRLGGSSDAGYILMGGTPVLCSFGIQGEWNHTTREYALLDSMCSRGKLISAVILNLKNFK